MSTDPNERRVPIHNRTTGESRLSEPLPVRPQRVMSSQESAPSSSLSDSALKPFTDSPAVSAASPSDSALSKEATPANETAPTSAETDTGDAGSDGSVPKNGAKTKTKPDIDTLEQFIAYAYARKGQRVVLKPKVERAIAGNPRLDDEATARLMELANADEFLQVPRQLLLASREVEGFPGLRGALSSFVKDVMLRHPVFAASGIQAVVRNLPDAPSMADAMASVVGYKAVDADGKSALKSADLQALRSNAAHLLAAWFACNRGLVLEDLASLLQHAIWAPAARELPDDNARLRALTEVEQPATLGLVSQRWRHQASEARAALERAERDAGSLRAQLAGLDAQLDQVRAELEARGVELESLRASTAEELARLRQQKEAERMHLRHDLEQLRGRLVRRLDDSIEMLEVGLTALRNKTPRTEVMAERAEQVVDALRAELNDLKED